jgi:hypothetical protein
MNCSEQLSIVQRGTAVGNDCCNSELGRNGVGHSSCAVRMGMLRAAPLCYALRRSARRSASFRNATSRILNHSRGSRYASESCEVRVQKISVASNHWVRPTPSLAGWRCNRAQGNRGGGRARKRRVLAMLCIWLCIGSACVGVFVGGLIVLLAARLP